VVAVRRAGTDLTRIENRTAPRVLWIGAAANLFVLSSALALTAFALQRPLGDLGFSASFSDALLGLAGCAVTFASAVAFVFLARGRRLQAAPSTGGGVFLGLVVLALVAVQEEVLFRGYLVLVLHGLAAGWLVLITTAIFVAIHIPTNRVDAPQLVSWTTGGVVLVAAYLLTGSLWVAIVLHFAVDAANLLVFRITGTHGWFRVEPALSSTEKAIYRVLYAALIGALLLAWIPGGGAAG
jgi:hypothetical protein